MEDDLSRIGISLPKNLLDRFDEILNYRGYSSRSEGIRDAIRTYITYYKWMADVKGLREGVITMSSTITTILSRPRCTPT
jgi:CopG family nickel-responsive transcriptional regulator